MVRNWESRDIRHLVAGDGDRKRRRFYEPCHRRGASTYISGPRFFISKSVGQGVSVSKFSSGIQPIGLLSCRAFAYFVDYSLGGMEGYQRNFCEKAFLHPYRGFTIGVSLLL